MNGHLVTFNFIPQTWDWEFVLQHPDSDETPCPMESIVVRALEEGYTPEDGTFSARYVTLASGSPRLICEPV